MSYADGTPRFEGRSTADGERRGLWTYWYPDGGVREQGPYVDGRRAGLWRQWHRNGRKLSEGERVWSDATRSSEREGTWTFWDASGIVRARGVFRSGRRDGRWTFFDEAGEPDRLRSGLYAAGIRVD